MKNELYNKEIMQYFAKNLMYPFQNLSQDVVHWNFEGNVTC